jgi:hypothetical protein
MTACKGGAAMAAAVELIRASLAAGIKPHALSIAAHYGVERRELGRMLAHEGIIFASGRMSAADVQRFAEAHPEISVRMPRLDEVSEHGKRWRDVLEGAPPHLELEDSCAHWGIEGAAEEYEVSEETICGWLRAYGVRGENNYKTHKRPSGKQERA